MNYILFYQSNEPMGNQQISVYKQYQYPTNPPQSLIQIRELLIAKKITADPNNRHKTLHLSADQLGSNTFLIVCHQDISQNKNTHSDILSYSGYIQIKSSDSSIIYFEGEVTNFQRNGFGIEYYENEKKFYEGYFKNNVYHGWGKMEDHQKQIEYEGEFSQGKKEGYGIWKYKGNYYEGSWQRDKFNGLGALNLEVSQINGFVDKQEIPQLNSKQRYVGMWKDNLKHGFGKYFKDSIFNTGQFANNYWIQKGVTKTLSKNQLTNNNQQK